MAHSKAGADPLTVLCRRASECAPVGSYESSRLLAGAGGAGVLAFEMSNTENEEKGTFMNGKWHDSETQAMIGWMRRSGR